MVWYGFNVNTFAGSGYVVHRFSGSVGSYSLGGIISSHISIRISFKSSRDMSGFWYIS